MIWVPSRSVVGASFTPYASGGSWAYTDSGWMFESDWDWGWAPFHYGRWYREPRYGWVWVPGSVWAPAWVDWRFGGGVVGWAPLPPRHHRTVWVFARAGDMHRRHVHRYLVRDARRYYRSTTPVRHRVRSGRAYWYSGPRRDQVERVGRVKVRHGAPASAARRRRRASPRPRQHRAPGAGVGAAPPDDHAVATRAAGLAPPAAGRAPAAGREAAPRGEAASRSAGRAPAAGREAAPGSPGGPSAPRSSGSSPRREAAPGSARGAAAPRPPGREAAPRSAVAPRRAAAAGSPARDAPASRPAIATRCAAAAVTAPRGAP